MDAAQRPRRVAKRRRKPVGDAEEKKADNVAAAPMAIEVEDEPARLPEIAAEEPEAASSRGKRVAKRRRKEAEPPADESDSGQKVSAEETTGTWWEGAQQLEERFAGLDMTLLCNRKGPTLFPDAQQGVQTLSQRPFSLSHLAQIKTIYPEAYTLEVRKTHPKEKLLHPSCGPYVLTLALPPGAKPVERKATFHERLVAFKAEGGIASSSTFEVPLSPLPEVPTAASLAQAKSAKSSHNAATERDQSAPASATEHDEIKTNNTAGETKAKYQSNTKEGRAERYAAVLRRVKEREAKLAAAGSAEEQKEAFLLKSLPQLNLVLRSLFVVKKFKPIPLDEALVQLCSSYRDAFGLSVEKQDVERRLKMLNELMPDMLQTKEGMDHNVFLVLPRGPIPGDRLQAAIDAKQEQQQPHDQKMAIDATVSKA